MRLSLLALLLVVVAAGCGGGSGSSSSSATVVASRDVNGSPVLVDGSGDTLYEFANGADCTGKCAAAWPPLLADGDVSAKKGSGIDGSLLGTVKRPDGGKQVTYDDHPLYTYADDSPGQSLGAGVHSFGGAWQVVHVSSNSFGKQKSKNKNCSDCGY